ncbi:hypothetical protein MCOR25_004931 [Pyricularia grisea]|nr:hypothetical protein MCOR25_004931 [Pyricularia grisea]
MEPNRPVPEPPTSYALDNLERKQPTPHTKKRQNGSSDAQGSLHTPGSSTSRSNLEDDGDDSAAGAQPPPSKSQKRRGRHNTACNFCRQRKARCNNERPRCGFCRASNQECIYAEEQERRQQQTNTADIISRLDELKNLLLGSTVIGAAAAAAAAVAPPPPPRNPQSRWPSVSDFDGANSPSANSSNSHRSPSGATHSTTPGPGDARGRVKLAEGNFLWASCESILRWPALRDLLLPEEQNIQSFVLSSDLDFDEVFVPKKTGIQSTLPRFQSPSDADSPRRRISEVEIVPLVDKFLMEVHVRNPILDEEELRRHARDVAENGMGWDGKTCLVLIACALACLWAGWHLPPPPGAVTAPCYPEREDVQGAAAFYLEARKRFGFLRMNILDLQCLHLANMFEKCAFRPLRAFNLMQAASHRLQVHLQRKAWRGDDIAKTPEAKKASMLEQRLFWSTVRLTMECLSEIPLQTTGIEQMEYPAYLPQLDGSVAMSENFERSWYWFLSEISWRRMMSNAVQTLYSEHDAEDWWIENVDVLMRNFDECEKQRVASIESLPEHIKAEMRDPNRRFVREATTLMTARLDMWFFVISNPLVYFVLHCPAGYVIPRAALDTARRCLAVGGGYIRDVWFHQRHGGSWPMGRRMFSICLTMLACAAAAVGGPERQRGLRPPEDWVSLCVMSHNSLARWAHESEERWRMCVLLRRMTTDVCARLGMAPPWGWAGDEAGFRQSVDVAREPQSPWRVVIGV